MHAVVRAVIATPSQFLKQPLCQPALPPGQLDLFLQDLRQHPNPFPKLGYRLHAALVPERVNDFDTGGVGI